MIITGWKSVSRGWSLIEVSLCSIVLALATIHGMLFYKDYINKKTISIVSFELTTLSDALEKYIQINRSALEKEDLSSPKEIALDVLYENGLLPKRKSRHTVFDQVVKFYVKKENGVTINKIVGLLLTTGGTPVGNDRIRQISLLQGGRAGESLDGNIFHGVSDGWYLNLKEDWQGVSYRNGHLLLFIDPNVANISKFRDVYNKEFEAANKPKIEINSVDTCFKGSCTPEKNVNSPNWYPVFYSDALIINLNNVTKGRYALEIRSADTNDILYNSFHKESKIILLPQVEFLNKNLDINIYRLDLKGVAAQKRVLKISAQASKISGRNKLSIAGMWERGRINAPLWHDGKTIYLNELESTDEDCRRGLIQPVTLKVDKISYTFQRGKSLCVNSFLTDSVLFSDSFTNDWDVNEVILPDSDVLKVMTIDVGSVTLKETMEVKIKFVQDDDV